MSRNHTGLNQRRWERTRRVVFKRDGYRCRRCGRPGRLECDHIVPLHKQPEQDPYDPANCQTLCRDHHIEKTGLENRKPPTPSQAAWRVLVNSLAENVNS